jgi:hypothetical protein
VVVLRSFQVAGCAPSWAGPSKTPIAVGAITRADPAAGVSAGPGSGVALLETAAVALVVAVVL